MNSSVAVLGAVPVFCVAVSWSVPVSPKPNPETGDGPTDSHDGGVLLSFHDVFDGTHIRFTLKLADGAHDDNGAPSGDASSGTEAEEETE